MSTPQVDNDDLPQARNPQSNPLGAICMRALMSKSYHGHLLTPIFIDCASHDPRRPVWTNRWQQIRTQVTSDRPPGTTSCPTTRTWLDWSFRSTSYLALGCPSHCSPTNLKYRRMEETSWACLNPTPFLACHPMLIWSPQHFAWRSLLPCETPSAT